MAKTVVLPKLGLTMTEGTVSKWLKKVGDEVKEGEPLFDIETDKLTNTIEATESGVLRHIFVNDGDTVPVLQKIAIIAPADEDISALIADAPESAAPVAADTPASAAKEENTVLVIGGGPGGYTAAIRAAQLGAKVTLIEKDCVGGTCLNRGCMPTKAMLHASEVYETANSSADLGITCSDVKVDWDKVQNFRAGIVQKLTSGVKALIKMNKIEYVQGEATFVGPKTVRVGDKEYTADKIIIATGSRPIIPNIPGLRDSDATIDSTAALALDHIPESLLVIGGGVIGLELGSVYNRFGTKVTVVEMQPKLLPLMEDELTGMLQAKLQGQGIDILLNSSVVKVEKAEKGAKVTVKTPEGEKIIECEKILPAVGRAAQIESLNLAKAGIAEENGFIKTNPLLETSVPGVYAIGDCGGKLMLAHAAMAMGEAAAENALGGKKVFKPELSPSCAYVGPEFAGVGLTEDQAKARGITYKVGRFPTSGNGRSLVSGHTDGMIKVLVGEPYGEILGVHILAPSATELIEEAALAIRLEATLDEFIDTIHCHPTVAEAMRESFLAAEKKAIHIPNKK